MIRETFLDEAVKLVQRDDTFADLTVRQLAVFRIVSMAAKSGEVITVRGLAATLGLEKSTITRALDNLSRHDLVRRQRDPQDGRSVLVSLGGEGYEAAGLPKPE